MIADDMTCMSRTFRRIVDRDNTDTRVKILLNASTYSFGTASRKFHVLELDADKTDLTIDLFRLKLLK